MSTMHSTTEGVSLMVVRRDSKRSGVRRSLADQPGRNVGSVVCVYVQGDV